MSTARASKVRSHLGYNVFRYAVSPGFFETIGRPATPRRLLNEHEMRMHTGGLISESLANASSEIAIHRQRVHVGPADRPGTTVVGWLATSSSFSLAVNQPDAVYIPTTHHGPWRACNRWSSRARGCGRIDSAIKQAICQSIDQRLYELQRWNALLTASAGAALSR